MKDPLGAASKKSVSFGWCPPQSGLPVRVSQSHVLNNLREGRAHELISFIVFLHVLKASASNGSKNKKWYFFGRKLWSGSQVRFGKRVKFPGHYRSLSSFGGPNSILISAIDSAPQKPKKRFITCPQVRSPFGVSVNGEIRLPCRPPRLHLPQLRFLHHIRRSWLSSVRSSALLSLQAPASMTCAIAFRHMDHPSQRQHAIWNQRSMLIPTHLEKMEAAGIMSCGPPPPHGTKAGWLMAAVW